MRKARAFSAGSVIRAVALGAALCAGAVAPGCTRESFNLLQVDAAGASAAGASNNAGASNGASGAANAGDSGGAASSANDLDAGAGRGGGRNGFGGFHGGAGATTTQAGGGANQAPCLAGDQCVDGGLNCPPTVQVCKRCTSNNDCDDSARFCDIPDGRCAECLHPDDCPVGDVCHPLTLRCMHSCNVSSDCVFEHDKPQCDMFHTCVSCNNDADCHEITGHQNDVCAFGTCADCYDDRQCPPQRQYCVGLVCQTKR
jgi:hypothetical protein